MKLHELKNVPSTEELTEKLVPNKDLSLEQMAEMVGMSVEDITLMDDIKLTTKEELYQQALAREVRDAKENANKNNK
jgi:hypothetical protein